MRHFLPLPLLSMPPREIGNALASVVFSTIINASSVKIPNLSGPRFLRRIGDTEWRQACNFSFGWRHGHRIVGVVRRSGVRLHRDIDWLSYEYLAGYHLVLSKYLPRRFDLVRKSICQQSPLPMCSFYLTSTRNSRTTAEI